MSEQEFNQRLKREFAVMQRKFPGFMLYKSQGRSYKFAPCGRIYWEGKLTTNFGTTYTVVVLYPANYPHGQLQAFVPELIDEDNVMHMYRDGHLCLYSNDHGGLGEGIGLETSASTIVAWCAAWLNAYEVFRRTGKWPGR